MSCPPGGDTGVGSADNGTSLQVGGSLGVAIIGSSLSIRYDDYVTTALAPHHLPHAISESILGSIGGAFQIAARLGGE